jgi:hypothetical protein
MVRFSSFGKKGSIIEFFNVIFDEHLEAQSQNLIFSKKSIDVRKNAG